MRCEPRRLLVSLGLLTTVAIFATVSAQAQTIIGSGTTTQTLSTDTAYQLNTGTNVSATAGDALVFNGIAPLTFTNGGTVISSTNGGAAAVCFNVNGSLVNQATGQILGNTF